MSLVSLLNRRLSMALLAVIAVPFLFITVSRLASPATNPSVPIAAGTTPAKSRFPYTDLTFSTGSKSFGAYGDYDIVNDVYNETLGFGAILLISLKSRTDRQDAVSLIGSTQNIKISKLIPAVRGEDINEKAMPFGKGKHKLPLPYLGSWRSHMDAFKYIIDNRIETALVFEDDIDWDIHVKTQMAAFARGLRNSPLRKPFSEDEQKRAPYGLDWDVMHLGTSRNQMAPPPNDNLFHNYHDPYTTPIELTQKKEPCGSREFFCWSDILKATQTNTSERVIYPSHSPVGLVALAVSFRGAQKLLYSLSWKSLDTSMDFGVRDGCRAGTLNGWSMTPPIMSSWRTFGAGDSDLRNGGKSTTGEGEGNMKGSARGLGWSARSSLQNLFDGPQVNFWTNGDAKWFGAGPAPTLKGVMVSAQADETVPLTNHQDSEQLPPEAKDGTVNELTPASSAPSPTEEAATSGVPATPSAEAAFPGAGADADADADAR